MAKWLATGPTVLMLDEPTRGIDVQAKNEIYELINELTAEGLAIVVVSSELPEVMTVSDRILVLCEGRATEEFDRENATEEAIMHAALARRDSARMKIDREQSNEVSIAHRAGVNVAGDEFAFGELSHSRKRTQHSASNLSQSLSLDRHDTDHPDGRNRPFRRSDIGSIRRVAAGLLKNGLPIEAMGIKLQFTVFGSIVAGLLTGAAAGLFNGIAVTRFQAAAVCGNPGYVQHCTRTNDAVDGRLSRHGTRTNIWCDWNWSFP